jgi:hypothetical protein
MMVLSNAFPFILLLLLIIRSWSRHLTISIFSLIVPADSVTQFWLVLKVVLMKRVFKLILSQINTLLVMTHKFSTHIQQRRFLDELKELVSDVVKYVFVL